MIRKCFVLFLCILHAAGPAAFASVLTVEEVSVIGAAADDYYTGSRPKLKVINGSNVGKTLVSSAQLSSTAALSGLTAGAAGIAGISYYQRTGKDPVYAVASALASAADALFVPAYQAFRANFVSPESYPSAAAQYVGTDASVGATLNNMINYVQSASSDLYSSFRALLSAATPGEIAATSITATQGSEANLVGTVWSDGTSSYKIGAGGWTGGLAITGTTTEVAATTFSGNYCSYIDVNGNVCYIGLGRLSGTLYFFFLSPYNATTTKRMYWIPLSSLTPVTDPITYPTPENALNFDTLKQNIANPSAEVAQDIQDIIKDLPADQKITSADPAPSAVPASSPVPITNNQIQNFFTENTTNVYNEYLNTVNNSTSTVTNEAAQAAAQAAQAQEEEVEEQTEENYSSISANAFGEAYNPGEYDIPARFTSFLNNVKSSGLFSFSSSFFNSLPGGGTPTYTIEAGRYGTHSIDLSDTMSTGLAVLKSILLACFGFLSIRAVIMKR